MPLIQSALDKVSPNVVADIAITALLIYWLFSLIRGTRAVRLVIGVCLLLLVYARRSDLRSPSSCGSSSRPSAYVGLFALVVVFQPELRERARSHRPPRFAGHGSFRRPSSRSRSTSRPKSPARLSGCRAKDTAH
jgi:DNA integrity scanning protein DisA with diadenylate cyclase activity